MAGAFAILMPDIVSEAVQRFIRAFVIDQLGRRAFVI